MLDSPKERQPQRLMVGPIVIGYVEKVDREGVENIGHLTFQETADAALFRPHRPMGGSREAAPVRPLLDQGQRAPHRRREFTLGHAPGDGTDAADADYLAFAAQTVQELE